jgi:hypothetical protein
MGKNYGITKLTKLTEFFEEWKGRGKFLIGLI